jgi:hypothetical protein
MLVSVSIYSMVNIHPWVELMRQVFLRKALQCLGAKHGTSLSKDDRSFLLSFEQPPPPRTPNPQPFSDSTSTPQGADSPPPSTCSEDR